MIRFHKMIYYNIHTHCPPASPDEKAILSIDIRKPHVPEPLCCYSAGIHPWYASEDYLDILYTIAKQSTIVAIGEAGLDKSTQTPWELQNKLFQKQIELSESLQKPLIIHCVKAWTELLASHRIARPSVPWIIHGFRGKKELAHQLLHSGFYISFGAYYQPEAVPEVWNAHRLFIETDQNHIGIQTVYASISSLLSVSPEDLSQEIHSNIQAWPLQLRKSSNSD